MSHASQAPAEFCAWNIERVGNVQELRMLLRA